MPSSCNSLRTALANCLQSSDCILIQHHQPLDCLSPPLLHTLPQECQQLKRGFRECKRGMVDMRKRFRGNLPVGSSIEIEGGGVGGAGVGGGVAGGVKGEEKRGQLYGGKEAFGEVPGKRGGRGDGVVIEGLGFDEDRTRGL